MILAPRPAKNCRIALLDLRTPRLDSAFLSKFDNSQPMTILGRVTHNFPGGLMLERSRGEREEIDAVRSSEFKIPLLEVRSGRAEPGQLERDDQGASKANSGMLTGGIW